MTEIRLEKFDSSFPAVQGHSNLSNRHGSFDYLWLPINVL